MRIACLACSQLRAPLSPPRQLGHQEHAQAARAGSMSQQCEPTHTCQTTSDLPSLGLLPMMTVTTPLGHSRAALPQSWEWEPLRDVWSQASLASQIRLLQLHSCMPVSGNVKPEQLKQQQQQSRWRHPLAHHYWSATLARRDMISMQCGLRRPHRQSNSTCVIRMVMSATIHCPMSAERSLKFGPVPCLIVVEVPTISSIHLGRPTSKKRKLHLGISCTIDNLLSLLSSIGICCYTRYSLVLRYLT